MKKKIAAAAMAASMVAGAGAGMILGVPGTALAQEAVATAGAPGHWLTDTLGKLVNEGTITQEQSDKVERALEASKPVRGPGGHPSPGVVAETLGIEESELRDALREGKTIAALATEKNVDVDTVIDAIVADREQRLADAVAAGRITQERADAAEATLRERATELVNATPTRHAGGRGKGPGFGSRDGGPGISPAGTVAA